MRQIERLPGGALLATYEAATRYYDTLDRAIRNLMEPYLLTRGIIKSLLWEPAENYVTALIREEFSRLWAKQRLKGEGM